ncbi:gliding motility-associated C-terminal domain-containing protein [Roseivirga sp.]|uniref:T9SS type B sorting domain-containing protein n=1 Tax=Roseivirga sp. TaxID=1964215 RepID=UPI003B51CD55
MEKSTRYFLSILAFFCLNFSTAQQYVKQDSIGIHGLDNPRAFWVDFNSDTYFDLVVYGKDTINGGTGIYLIRNNGDDTFTSKFNSLSSYDIRQLKVLDYQRDGQVDLSFTGIKNLTDSLVSVFTINNEMALTEIATRLLDSLVTDYYLTDLDNDTDLDLLYLKDSALRLFEASALGLATESVELNRHKVGQLLLTDLNSDGLKDWVLTTPEDPDTLNRIYLNQGGLEWEVGYVEPLADSLLVQTVSIGKWKDSPFPDFLTILQQEDNRPEAWLIENTGDSLKMQRQVFKDSLVQEIFLADFNSNGSTDVFIQGSEGISYFLEESPELTDTVRLASPNTYLTRFGDWNLDGHLDLFQLQLLNTDSLQVIIYKNDLAFENEGPLTPGLLTAVQDGTEEILVWSATTDDFTESSLISYDLSLNFEDNPMLLSEPNANFLSELLTIPYHGALEYNRKIIYNELNAGDYYYVLRGVDNAFNLQPLNGTGECKFTVCELSAMRESEVTACPGEVLSFGKAGVIRHWYSSLYGPIGTTDVIEYVASGNDVLYGSVTRNVDCGEGQLKIAINVPEGESIDLQPSYVVCSGEALSLSIPASFTNVSWNSSTTGVLSTSNEMSFEPVEDQTIEVSATNNLGCPVSFTTEIDYSLFEPGVRDSVLTIEAGASIELNAFGGNSYEWSPAIGLSHTTIANPLASPTATVVYTVIITNSQGCTQLLEVTVNVQQKGNIANLFSPNGDGNNDELKVFLTGQPSQFEFQIFNRSGVLVYATNDALEAMNRGWDGSYSGENMPTGVYYWRVSGNYESGQRVLLNGEQKGSFTLIR